MALYSTYDQVGQKESIEDIIVNISPTKTPFQSAIGTEKITARLHQWQEDSLAAEALNAKVEGFTAGTGSAAPTTLRSNNTQIISKDVLVSGTADAIGTYGRAKESAYQMGKVSAEVKRDLERALVGVIQAAVMTNLATARLMASAWSQVAAGVTTAGGSAAITEAKILANLQALYDAGGESEIIMVKTAHAGVIANFAYAAGRTRNIGTGSNDRTVVNAVDLYVSPFGTARVVLNRFQLLSNVLLFNPDNWKLLVLRNWFRETLAKTGDSTNMMIVGEFSLKHDHQSLSGMINALI